MKNLHDSVRFHWRQMSFEHGLSAFQKHMKENVVPSTFGDLSIDEVESLILAQWNEIPEQAKQEWRDKSSSEPQIVETKPSDNASAAHSDSIDKLTTEIQEKLTIEKVEAKGTIFHAQLGFPQFTFSMPQSLFQNFLGCNLVGAFRSNASTAFSF